MRESLEGTGFAPKFLVKTDPAGGRVPNVPDEKMKADALQVVHENEVKMDKI